MKLQPKLTGLAVAILFANGISYSGVSSAFTREDPTYMTQQEISNSRRLD